MKKEVLFLTFLSLFMIGTSAEAARKSYLIQNELVISTNAQNSVPTNNNNTKFMFIARSKDENTNRVKGIGLVHPLLYGGSGTPLRSKISTLNMTFFPKAKLDIVITTNHTFNTDVTIRHRTRTGIFGFNESNDQFSTTAINLNESSDLEAENNFNHFEFMAKFVSGNSASTGITGAPAVNARVLDFGPTHMNLSDNNAGIILKSIKGTNKKTETYAGINIKYWGSAADYYNRPTASLEVWGDVAATGMKGRTNTLPLFHPLHKLGSYRTSLEGVTFDFQDNLFIVKFYSHADILAANGAIPNIPTKALRFSGFDSATNAAVDTVAEAKTFTIQHPLDARRYLIHAMIESPESRVYYRGEAKLKRGKALVKLPDYVEALTHEDGVHVQLTSIDSFDRVALATQKGKKVHKGKFLIKSENPNSSQIVQWEVSAIRKDIDRLLVEPHKSEVTVHGKAPYLYYTPN